jgi:hypothetical protein
MGRGERLGTYRGHDGLRERLDVHRGRNRRARADQTTKSGARAESECASSWKRREDARAHTADEHRTRVD